MLATRAGDISRPVQRVFSVFDGQFNHCTATAVLLSAVSGNAVACQPFSCVSPVFWPLARLQGRVFSFQSQLNATLLPPRQFDACPRCPGRFFRTGRHRTETTNCFVRAFRSAPCGGPVCTWPRTNQHCSALCQSLCTIRMSRCRSLDSLPMLSGFCGKTPVKT